MAPRLHLRGANEMPEGLWNHRLWHNLRGRLKECPRKTREYCRRQRPHPIVALLPTFLVRRDGARIARGSPPNGKAE
jgi:hypothetical protein